MTGPGRESVWDYPRPPRLESAARRIRVIDQGLVLADSRRALRLLETSHPPTYYLPPADVRLDLLTPSAPGSFCEWKGWASYFDVRSAGVVRPRSVWTYPEPTDSFHALKDHLAFFAGAFDACLVDEETAQPQPGGFYGGWITSDLEGPFKGAPGTMGW
jgi:uncharacterized protein (DUF427 family)